MSRHFQREVDRLKKQVLTLSAMVEEAVQKSVTAVARRDAKLAREVVDGDQEIDSHEVEIEEECLKVLALHQPVAADLRFLVVVLKMTDELERIADLAVNIAHRAAELAELEPIEIPFDFTGMAEKVEWMLGRGIDSLVNLDIDTARDVWAKDAEVDAIHRQMYGAVKMGICERQDQMEQLIHLMGVSRYLERIADHATSIVKDVIYMVEGEIVRHRGKEWRAQHQAKSA